MFSKFGTSKIWKKYKAVNRYGKGKYELKVIYYFGKVRPYHSNQNITTSYKYYISITYYFI